MVGFDVVWQRIRNHEGELFRQKGGGEFRYSIAGNVFIPDRTNRQIAKSQFEKAFEILPLENTVPIQGLQGPSYIFAVLMDHRIKGNDW